MMDSENIKRFVRKNLGCMCPEQIFKYIRCESKVDVGDNIVLDYEINVGNRLLIFVIQADDNMDRLGPVISQLIQTGTSQRNEQEFNRFRLVLVCKTPDSIADEALTVFNSISVDDRVHLHVIAEHEMPVGT